MTTVYIVTVVHTVTVMNTVIVLYIVTVNTTVYIKNYTPTQEISIKLLVLTTPSNCHLI